MRLAYLSLLLALSACEKDKTSPLDALDSVETVHCVYAGNYCKFTVGDYSYCTNHSAAEGVAIDCKIYYEAHKLFHEELWNQRKAGQ